MIASVLPLIAGLTGCASHIIARLANPESTLLGATARLHLGAFLDDIAHAANPAGKTADNDTALGLSDSVSTVGKFDNELLDRHFATGDGRGNENIGLTSVHHIFHAEHNRQIDAIKATVLASGSGIPMTRM